MRRKVFFVNASAFGCSERDGYKMNETQVNSKKFTKQEKSWIMYDWANSSYVTIMVAAIFPIYFAGVVGEGGDAWFGIGTSIATACVAVLSPILGAVGDYKGMKKKLLATFLLLGLASTTFCALINNWQGLLIGYIISAIGFNGSCVFYDSFLTDITTRERMDKVSTWGYGFGYIGGSTIPFLISIAITMFGPSIGIGEIAAVKMSLIICVVWWGAFSIPILKNCTQKYGSEMPKTNLLGTTFKNLAKSMRRMFSNKALVLFMVAYFFYIDGVHTVISMSSAYGASLGLDTTGMILALLVTQVVAFPCAILFGKIAGKVGSINMLIVSVFIYFFICIMGFIMGFGIEEAFLTNDQALAIFWLLAISVGLVQGGIQALSRSYFGKIIPPEYSNEYFGVFDIFGKVSTVMGPAIYAFVRTFTGRSSYAIFSIIILFLIGAAILITGRKTFNSAFNVK